MTYLKSDLSNPKSSSFLPNLSVAMAVIGLVIAGEYIFRHYVLFWMPIIGTIQVNDMISLSMAYFFLLFGIGKVMKTDWRQELAGIWQAIQASARSWNFTIWFILLVLSIVILPFFDNLFWGRFTLPMLVSSYRNSIVMLSDFAPILTVLSVILVNGVFVPIAEEYLWRGIAQTRFLRIMSSPLAIGITSVLFSFKHVLVDASWGRFLTLAAFGVICGVVADQKGWRSSAVLHIFINTIATVMGLVVGVE
jgi:membrane protease YdiL (CAAX protease family)